MPTFRFAIFVNILVAYLVIGMSYAILTPKWQAPDEPAHYNYVRFLATNLRLPELINRCYDQDYLNQLTSRRFPPDLTIDYVCYEFHQPPLYYLLSAPIFILSNGSLLALRMLSLVLGAGVVIMAYFVARTISPIDSAIALGTMAFVAFVPMHLAILASVNNDALAELVLAALLLLLSRRLLSPTDTSARSDVLLGVMLGIGLVTKATVYIAIPLIAVVLWLNFSAQAKQQGGIWPWTELLKQAGLIFGLALVIALPWYIRNASLYGDFDILGLAQHDAVVAGQLRTAEYLAEIGGATYLSNFLTTTFRSFWGQFGWMAVPMDNRVYLVLILVTLTALGGLIGFWISDFACPDGPSRGFWKGASSLQISASRHLVSNGQRRALALMALAIALMALAYGWYNLTFVQLQGRYLFPALIPLGLFFSLGLREAFARRWIWWLVVGLGLALGWVVITSVLKDGLDKWAVLITGLPLGLAVGRAVLARYWFAPATWLVAACYVGLAVLALVSPFWFVAPYLSP